MREKLEGKIKDQNKSLADAAKTMGTQQQELVDKDQELLGIKKLNQQIRVQMDNLKTVQEQ